MSAIHIQTKQTIGYVKEISTEWKLRFAFDIHELKRQIFNIHSTPLKTIQSTLHLSSSHSTSINHYTTHLNDMVVMVLGFPPVNLVPDYGPLRLLWG